MIHAPITKLQCSPTSDGAAAALVCSEAFVVAHGLEAQAVEIVAQSMGVIAQKPTFTAVMGSTGLSRTNKGIIRKTISIATADRREGEITNYIESEPP